MSKHELAGLEATDGNVQVALDALDHVIDAFHQLGDTATSHPRSGTSSCYLIARWSRMRNRSISSALSETVMDLRVVTRERIVVV